MVKKFSEVVQNIREVKEPTGKLKDACWKGYTAVGMKMKNGRKVPNCVPVKEENNPYVAVHAKKGKHETHGSTSYEAAQNAAKHWKMKNTSGISVYRADKTHSTQHVGEQFASDKPEPTREPVEGRFTSQPAKTVTKPAPQATPKNEEVELDEAFNKDKKDPRGGTVMIAVNPFHDGSGKYEVSFKPNRERGKIQRGRVKSHVISSHHDENDAEKAKHAYAAKHGYDVLKPFKANEEVELDEAYGDNHPHSKEHLAMKKKIFGASKMKSSYSGNKHTWTKYGGYADTTFSKVKERAKKLGFKDGSHHNNLSPDGSTANQGKVMHHKDGHEIHFTSSFGPTKYYNNHSIEFVTHSKKTNESVDSDTYSAQRLYDKSHSDATKKGHGEKAAHEYASTEMKKKYPNHTASSGEGQVYKKANEEVEQIEEMPGANMDTRAVHKHLRKSGWSLTRTKGSHDVYTHPKSEKHIAVPRHKQLKAPLVRGIMKDAHVSEDIEQVEESRGHKILATKLAQIAANHRRAAEAAKREAEEQKKKEPVKEEKKGSWQKDTGWKKDKGDAVDKSGAKHSAMSRAKHLAKMASRKKVLEQDNNNQVDNVQTPAKKSLAFRGVVKNVEKPTKGKKLSGDDKFEPEPELNTQIMRNNF